jgi:hypothetical protein
VEVEDALVVAASDRPEMDDRRKVVRRPLAEGDPGKARIDPLASTEIGFTLG